MVLALEFVIIGVISFIAVAVALIISILSMNKFLKSKIKSYLIWINVSYLFIVLPYALWVITQLTDMSENLIYIFNWVIFITMAIDGVLFIKAALSLKKLANVFGFKNK